jgi:hypothetical protein
VLLLTLPTEPANPEIAGGEVGVGYTYYIGSLDLNLFVMYVRGLWFFPARMFI